MHIHFGQREDLLEVSFCSVLWRAKTPLLLFVSQVFMLSSFCALLRRRVGDKLHFCLFAVDDNGFEKCCGAGNKSIFALLCLAK